MERTTDIKETQPEKKSVISSRALDMGANAAAATVGYAVLDNSTRNAVYQKYKDKIPEIKDLAEDRSKEIKRIWADAEGKYSLPHTKARALREIEKKYTKDLKDIFRKEHVGGIRDCWTSLGDTARWKVGAEAFTIAGITLGVILTAVNFKSISEVFSRQEKENNNSQSR